MPGFGLPGIVGLAAFLLYFVGGYVAGLSGAEWVGVFLVGVALVAVELFVYPGTIFLGITGAALMAAALVMAMVDLYPSPSGVPGLPAMPSIDKFQLPMRNLAFALLGGGIGVWLVSRLLPKTPLYRSVISTSASGVRTEAVLEKQQKSRLGQTGVTLSPLRPGGKAQVGDAILDVMSQGEMVGPGVKVHIIGSSGVEAVVEVVKG